MSDFLGIGHAVKHATHDVTHTADQVGHAVEGGVMQIRHAVEGGVLQIQQETDKGLHKIRGELPDIESAVEGALRKALEEFEKALAGPLLRQIVTLLESAAPDTVWLSIGPVTFTISQIPDKIERVKHWVNNPPQGPNDIMHLIDDLAPADIEIALKVNVPGTQSLTLGATLVYYPATFKDRLRTIWEAVT